MMRNRFDRRRVLGGLGAAAFLGASGAMPRLVGAQGAAARLPVRATFLEHMGTVVADVLAATRFHSRLFNPAIMTERNPTPLRCYVDLSPGYLAFGSRPNIETAFYDHYCAVIEDYEPEALAVALGEAGLPQNNPAFTLFPDPDGIGVQLYSDPGGWFPTVVPMDAIVEGPSLVSAHGLEHVMLHVADVDASLAFYRRIFGAIDVREGDMAWLVFPDTRLGIRPVPEGGEAGIDHIRVRVSDFDIVGVATAIVRSGARLGTVWNNEPGVLAFTDPQGLKFELAVV